MGWGDEVLAAGQAQSLWTADPSRRIAICDHRGRPRWHPLWEGNPIIARPEQLAHSDEDVVRLISAPNARPYIIYPFTAETGWTFNPKFRAADHIARIYLTRAELQVGAETRRKLGPYVVFDPWSKHPNLRWPLEHWQRLVKLCPDITFVQQIYTGSPPPLDAPNVHPIPTTSFREACGLLVSAVGYVRGESGMCHAAAALAVPCLTIWGGCMDWRVLGGYPRQRGIGVAIPPCGSYKPCAHCAQIMRNISPIVVAREVVTMLGAAFR